MTPLRNEKTEAGKELWRKVDQAASRAPQWIQNHISTLVAQHVTPTSRLSKNSIPPVSTPALRRVPDLPTHNKE